MIPGLLNYTRTAFMRRVGALASQHLTRNLFTLNAKSVGELDNSVRMRAPYPKHDAHCSLPLAERFQCGIEGNVGSVTYEDIKRIQRNRNKLLIDVREEAETGTGIIPGSINIPLSVLEDELSNKVSAEEFRKKYGKSKPTENTDIIMTCFNGKRSHLATERLLALGYHNVRYYPGSWKEYAEKNNIRKPKYR